MERGQAAKPDLKGMKRHKGKEGWSILMKFFFDGTHTVMMTSRSALNRSGTGKVDYAF
jgi:hypothetical protein